MSKAVLSDIVATFEEVFPGKKARKEKPTEAAPDTVDPPAHDLANCAGIYEALSYVWTPRGSPIEATPIQVDDKTIYIGSNLRVALYNLRYLDKPRTLWIDALCIDQSSVVERNQQVAFMRDIYRSASRTVIWLGDSIKPTAVAFRALEELAAEAATRVENSSTRLDEDDALGQLVQWHQLWTRYRRQRLLQLLSTEPQHDHPSESQQLLDNLVRCRFRDATDARDKVYGVLGLTITTSLGTGATPEELLGITPDYDSPFQEVYRHTARRLIISSRSLNVLGSCTSPANDQLPTWVPDWSFTGVVALPLTKDAFDRPRLAHASRGSEARPLFENTGNDLVLQGHELTTIVVLAPILRRPPVPSGDINVLKPKAHTTTLGSQCLGRLGCLRARVEPRNPGGATNGEGDPMTVYWQTLSTGTFLPSRSNTRARDVPEATEAKQPGVPNDYAEKQRKQETAESFYVWRASLKTARDMHRWDVDRRARPVAFLGCILNTWKKYNDFARLLENAYERRLARCENGYLALVPATAEEGDGIVLVEGGVVPLVLRQDSSRDAGDNWCRLVGEAYVHGVMNGDAFRKDELVVFTIK
ncbi:hypothetical protein CHU98_g5932 [Xylaria longipes]|nr:hypothetical protein CHU98_g5932 [Xylaria longipes]